MSTELVEIQSKPSHKFVKGQSGNPAGRPKGSKNAITLAKLALEGELRQEMKGRMSAILRKGLEEAEAGNTDMIKYFLDMWVTKAKASSDDDAPRERVQILIGRLDNKEPPVVSGRTIPHEAQ